MPERRLITASMVRDLAICEHRLHLDLAGDPLLRDDVGEFVEMLWEGGLRHERDVLSKIEGRIADLRDIPWAKRRQATEEAVKSRMPTILGASIAAGEMLGMPDVMRLTPDEGYVAGDVKNGAGDERGGPDGRRLKKSYGIQISHYAKIISASQWGPRENAFIIDASGHEVPYRLDDAFDTTGMTMNRLHEGLLHRAVLIRDGAVETTPALGSPCAQCHWRTICKQAIVSADDPTLIADVGRAVRSKLGPQFGTVAAIAAMRLEDHMSASGTSTMRGVGIERLERLRDRAILLTTPGAKAFARKPLDLPVYEHEIHYDVESDPLQGGVVYLHGFHEVFRSGNAMLTRYQAFFADTLDDEMMVFAEAYGFLRSRARGHIYVWSRFERTSMRALQARYPSVCSPEDVELLFHADRCTDLYTDVTAPHTEWPLGGYGLKKIARAVGFEWRDADPSGANSIAWFSQWLSSGDPAVKERIIIYNEDDVRATSAVLMALRKLPVRREKLSSRTTA